MKCNVKYINGNSSFQRNGSMKKKAHYFSLPIVVALLLLWRSNCSKYTREDGVVLSSENKLHYFRTEYISNTTRLNSTGCSIQKALNNAIKCVCMLTLQKFSSILIYSTKETSYLLDQMFKSYGYSNTNALLQMQNSSPYYKKEEGHILGRLASQFNVRGTAVIKCNDYDNDVLVHLLHYYQYHNVKGVKKIPTFFNITHTDYNVRQIISELHAVKSTDVSLIIVLCPSYFSALLLDLAFTLNLGNTRYVWMLQQPFHPHASRKPTNILAVVPVSQKQTKLSIEEHVFLRRQQLTTQNEKYTSTGLRFCELIRKHSNSPLKTGTGYFVTKENRSYLFDLLTLSAKGTWAPVGQIDASKSFTFLQLSQALETFPRHVSLKSVKTVTKVDPPFVILATSTYWEKSSKKCMQGVLCWRVDSASGNSKEVPECCIGYMIDLLIKIRIELGLKIHLYLVQDSTYGSYDTKTKKWNGMIGELAYGSVELAFASLTISSARAKVIDFTEPFMTGGIGMLTVSSTDESITFLNFLFLKPLSTDLWMVVFGGILAFSSVMMLMESIPHFCKFTYIWREAILYLFGLAFQRDLGGKNPTGLGTRTATITIAVATMILMSTYTAVLTANKVSNKQKLPVSGFRDEKIINPTSAFKFGIPTGSVYEGFFKNSKDPAFHRLHFFMKPYNFINTDKAIADLKSGNLNAIIHDYAVLYHYVAKEPLCQLQLAGKPLPDAGLGLAVKKNSDLNAPLSDALRRYKENGFLDNIKAKWMNSKCVSLSDAKSALPKELKITHFGGLIILVILSIALSILVYIIEYSIWRVKLRFIRQANLTHNP